MVLLPVFFLPITASFFLFNKLALLVIFVFVSLILWSARNLKEFKFFTTPLDVPLFLLTVVFLISALAGNFSFIDAFVNPGTATVFIGSALTFFIITQYIASADDKKQRADSLIVYLLAGVFLASLISLLIRAGILADTAKALNLPAWLQASNLSPTGDTLSAILLFLITIPLFFERALRSYRENETEERIFKTAVWLVVIILFLMGTALTIYVSLPGKVAQFTTLPFRTGWSIALETLKEQPILGVGPGNFVEAYDRFRPVQHNQTDVWNVRFQSSSNFYLDIATITGIAGIAALLFFLWRLKKVLIQGKSGQPYLTVSIVLALVLFLFVPAGLVVVVSLFTLVALASAPGAQRLSIQFSSLGEGGSNVPIGINLISGTIGLAAVVGFVAVLYFGGRAYAAEMYYRKALDVISSRGTYKDAMDNLQRAAEANPREDAYRISLSQIALSLMQNIVSKKELTDEDRSDVSQLVQFAIQQGKAAVALNQGRSENWANLAQIYQSVMPLAKGADQWAVASYQQAIVLDPTNPILRVNLAGIFYGIGNYEAAADAARLAVTAKGDWANAHYNFALALREQGKLQEALQEMRRVITLVQPNSKDYDLAKSVLDDLEKQLKKEKATAEPKEQKQTEQQLQTPQPVRQELTPPINLPQESAPPATQSAQPKQEGK